MGARLSGRDRRADDAFHALAFPEQFTLWAIRTWVHGRLTGQPVGRLLSEGFQKIRAREGRDLLGQFMTALAGGAARTLATNCPCCLSVTADERRLLALIGSLQRTDPREATLRLSDFVKPEWCSPVAFSANLLAACLARCGLSLGAAEPRERPQPPGFTARTAASEGSMRTLH